MHWGIPKFISLNTLRRPARATVMRPSFKKKKGRYKLGVLHIWCTNHSDGSTRKTTWAQVLVSKPQQHRKFSSQKRMQGIERCLSG